MQVYLAAPLFTQAERRWLRELSAELRMAGYEVFLPQDDAGEPLLQDPPDFHGAFEACRDAIDRCEIVVAILDGADADSGTAWECGYAYARAKPVIVVRTDFRGGEDSGLNLMLRRAAYEVIEQPATDESLQHLAVSIARVLKKIQ